MVRRDIETDMVPYCVKKNIGILAYSPLQRGLLSGKIKPGHKFNEGDNRPDTPYYKEPNLTRILSLLEKIRPIAEGHNATLSQLALNWTIQQPGITCALAGARNPAQVLENKGAADFMLTNDEINRINNYISDIQIDTKL
jgi:aryl-alcohol dehydrogenase-like predicted oxidoreductase